MTALALMMVQRYFVFNSFRVPNIEPDLIVVSAIFLAVKLEDCHVRTIDEVKKAGMEVLNRKIEERRLLQHERQLLVGLRFVLDFPNPFDYLTTLTTNLRLPDLTNRAWNLLGKAMMTRAPLLYDPFTIALTMLYCAAQKQPELLCVDVACAQRIADECRFVRPAAEAPAGRVDLVAFFDMKTDEMNSIGQILSEYLRQNSG